MNRPLSTVQRMKVLGPLQPGFRFGRPLLPPGPHRFRQVYPLPRNWVVIGIVAGMFAVFSIPLLAVSGRFDFGGDGSLFDLVFGLFHMFWALGWSLFVVALAAVLVVLLFGREIVQADRDGLELRFELLGLGVSAVYPPARLSRLRAGTAADAEPGSSWRGDHLVVDYLDIPIAFGSRLDAADADTLRRGIENALGFEIADELSISMQYQREKQEQAAVQAGRTAATLRAAQVAGRRSAEATREPLTWRSPSALALIAANMVPLVGVLSFGWNIGELFLLYWLESAIVGLYNVARMVVIGRWLALPASVFFVAHYGAFMVGHLLFLVGFFIDDGPGVDASVSQVADLMWQLWPAIVALVISHGFSFVDNFLHRHEYEGRTIKDQMGEPYSRIFVMHVTIIFGGFLAMALGSPFASLVLLIALKLVADLTAHLKQHRGTGISAPE